MGYLKVVVNGHKTAAGFVTIMRPNMSSEALLRAEKPIRDGTEMLLGNGPQTIRYDSIGMAVRGNVKRNFYEKKQKFNYNTNQYTAGYKFEEYYDAAVAVDNLPKVFETTFDNIKEDTLVTLTVSTDYNGRVLGNPEYSFSTITPNEAQKMKSRIQYLEETARAREEENTKKREEQRKADKRHDLKKFAIAAGIWLLVAIISFFVAKYFMPIDRYNSNIFAIASFVCGIFGIVNLFKLIKRSCS